MTDFNPPNSAWHVIHIEEDQQQVKVTLERVSWATADDPDDELTEWTEATPGEPGSGWVGEGVKTTLTFDREAAQFFDIGRHYVLALTEVQDASVMAI